MLLSWIIPSPDKLLLIVVRSQASLWRVFMRQVCLFSAAWSFSGMSQVRIRKVYSSYLKAHPRHIAPSQYECCAYGTERAGPFIKQRWQLQAAERGHTLRVMLPDELHPIPRFQGPNQKSRSTSKCRAGNVLECWRWLWMSEDVCLYAREWGKKDLLRFHRLSFTCSDLCGPSFNLERIKKEGSRRMALPSWSFLGNDIEDISLLFWGVRGLACLPAFAPYV